MQTLTKIQQEHNIPNALYQELKHAIQFSLQKNDKDI